MFAVRLHTIAYPPRPLPGLVEGVPSRQLPDVGDYRFVSIQTSEFHMNHPDTLQYLQSAVEKNDYTTYRQYSDVQNSLVDEIELRGQLEFVYVKQRPLHLKEIEPAENIVKRLVCSAISFGDISEEAFTTLAIAMNSIGSRSNTGEGGELDDVTDSSMKSKTKQIASGRFGVTSFFLSDCDELQIKVDLLCLCFCWCFLCFCPCLCLCLYFCVCSCVSLYCVSLYMCFCVCVCSCVSSLIDLFFSAVLVKVNYPVSG